MKFFLIVVLVFHGAFCLKAQYKPFPKLEKLFEVTDYDQCLEKAEAYITADSKEIYPYIWQMRCYLAISNLDNHPLKKNALTKALNVAIRIKNKDKSGELSEVVTPDFENIQSQLIEKLSGYSDEQYTAGIGIFNKLQQLSPSLTLDYHKYIFMKDHNGENAFSELRILVSKHYALFKKAPDKSENLEQAYADLINAYYDLYQPTYARDAFVKSKEVYKKGDLCKDVYIKHIMSIVGSAGYYTDEKSLNNYLLELLSADSLLSIGIFKSMAIDLKKYLAVAVLRSEPEGSTRTINYLNNYLNSYKFGQLDSLVHLFDYLLEANRKEYGRIDKQKIFAAWLTMQQKLIKNASTAECIKSIHQNLISKKKFDDDFDFIAWCKLKYPAFKGQLSAYHIQLEKLIVQQISSDSFAASPEVIDLYAKKLDSKEIKDKQYKTYYTQLLGLLSANDFSGFAVNIVKALNQFPGDIRFLALKKKWVIADYNANYKSLAGDYGYEKYFSKLPNESKCEPGVVNKLGHDAVLQKINYCRRLAGVPDSCVIDNEVSPGYQKAALMMSANDNLSHSPPATWKCYSKEGAGAAGASNLSLGNAFYDAIMSQMEDDGEGNFAAGHRRWILNPKNTVFGHGSTTNTLSLGVFGTGNKNLKRPLYFDIKQPICWPAPDYFPANLLPKRWSFSLANGEFDKAIVTVREGGKLIPVTKEPIAQGFALNSIVFYLSKDVEIDKIYTVTITNVTTYSYWGDPNNSDTSKGKTYTYQVIPIAVD